MDRKGNAKQGAASPRGYLHSDEDVFDFPGVDEGSGSGPVARERFLALKEGNNQHTSAQSSVGTITKQCLCVNEIEIEIAFACPILLHTKGLLIIHSDLPVETI